MMNFTVLTLFPEMITEGLSHSIIKRAVENKIINIDCIDIRNFALNRHRHVDDYPYGGGAGMIMQAQPIYDAYMSIPEEKKGNRVIYMNPQGKLFNQKIAEEFSKEENIVMLCGHYEGIDERIIEEIVTDEISIGNYIITGGELAAMVVIDSVSRLIHGVLNKDESFKDETFSNGLLEYPQYTRPLEFMGRKVPDVLLSGHHKNIDLWRKEQSLLRTYKKRPDLLESAELDAQDKKFITAHKNEKPAEF